MNNDNYFLIQTLYKYFIMNISYHKLKDLLRYKMNKNEKDWPTPNTPPSEQFVTVSAGGGFGYRQR